MPSSIAPSSSPPPPRSGGGIYIAVAVLLIAAIGGLVVWKMKSGGEAPVVQAPLPVPTSAPALVEPPPPPPPPSATEEPSQVDAGARVSGGGYNPCAARCTGKSNAAMESALTARAGAARPCYERALRVNSTLQGKLMVNVRIDPQGNVCSTSIAQDAIHSIEVANCVMGMFRSAKFPPPTGGCAEVNVPLSFVPREGK